MPDSIQGPHGYGCEAYQEDIRKDNPVQLDCQVQLIRLFYETRGHYAHEEGRE